MAELIKGSLLFPVIQSIHIIGLAILVGTITFVDFGLLGIGTRRISATDLAAGLAPWTVAGLITVLVTGPLMFWSDLPRYIHNPAFLAKMALFALAVAQHVTVHRRATRFREASPGRPKLAAMLSLLLWSGVILAGRAIADFDIFPL